MLQQDAQQGADRVKGAIRSRKNATYNAISGLDHSLQITLGSGLERFLPGDKDVGFLELSRVAQRRVNTSEI